MMFMALVGAMVVGPLQLWLLASPTRTIGIRTVLSSILAGVAIAFPATVAVEWLWIRAADPLWDGIRFEFVRWAGWTIDPFIEELVRLLPLVIVVGLVGRVRSQWSLTDLTVVGLGVGSGFRLAEHIARHAEESRGPLAGLSDNGWVVGFGFDGTIIVPYPWVWLTQWMPEGVQADTIFGDPDPLLRYNLIAIWGALGGLSVGLWMVSGRQAIPARVWAGRVAAVGLVVFAGLAHAQANADLINEDWGFPVLALPRLLARWYWAWPLVALAVAGSVDHRVLKAQRTDPALDRLRLGSGRDELSNLLRLAMQQPLVSMRTVSAFVTTRRAVMLMGARNGGDPDDASTDRSQLVELLAPAAEQLRRQLHDGGELWSELTAARKRARRQRWSAWFRSPQGWLFGGASLLLVLVPTAYFVAGTGPGGYEIQRWMSMNGAELTVVAAVAGVTAGVVMLGLRLRALRRMPDVVAEPKAGAVLALAITIGAVGSMLYGLLQVRSGAGLGTRVFVAHGLDALGSLLWSAALNLGLLALVAVNPVSGWPLLVEHHRFKSGDELLAMLPIEVQLLVHIGHTIVAAEGRAVPGEWEEGPKPASPLDAELDAIIEHAWKKHVLGEDGGTRDFPEIRTKEELREALEDVIENATEWGYRKDGSVYWYDELTDTVVIKNPPGIGGTTYRPGEEQDG